MPRRDKGDGTIRYRKTDKPPRWMGTITVSTRPRRRKSFYGKTRAEVVVKMRAARTDPHKAARSASDRLTVEAHLAEWLAAQKPPIRRPATWRRYEQIVRVHLVPVIGPIRVTELTRADVERLMRAMIDRRTRRHPNGLSLLTASHVRAVLRTALNRAVEDEIVVRNVAADADWTQPQPEPVQVLDPAQVQTLLATLRDDPLGLLLTVALATGARQGELLALCWSDIDFDQRTVTIRHSLQGGLLVPPKTKRSMRTIAMADPVETALRRQKAHQAEQRLWAGSSWQKRRANEHRDAADFVFTSPTGWALDGTTVTKAFQSALKAAELPRMRFHDLRHTAASLLLGQGVHARVVMELLGHSTIRLTMDTYSHVMPELKRDAADQIGPLLWGAVSESQAAV